VDFDQIAKLTAERLRLERLARAQEKRDDVERIRAQLTGKPLRRVKATLADLFL